MRDEGEADDDEAAFGEPDPDGAGRCDGARLADEEDQTGSYAAFNRMAGNSDLAFQAGRTGDVTFNIGGSREIRLAKWQIKRAIEGFVNRHAEVGELGGVFDDPIARVALVMLLGPAGVGKTELGLRLAKEYRKHFGYGYHVALSKFRGGGGAVDLSAVFRVLLLAMGVAESMVPSTYQEREALYHARTAARDVLVMVDDVELPGQVEALAPRGGGALLVTSQRMLEQWRGKGIVVVEVGPLDDQAALAMLSNHIGAGRVAAEPEAAAELVRWCEGIPALLVAVGGHLVLRERRRLAQAVAMLRDAQERSRLFERAEAFTVLDVMFAELPEQAARAYRALGFLPAAETSTDAVAVAAGITEAQAASGLDDLVEARLLEDLGVGRFAVHAMFRAHAVHLVTRAYSEAERSAVTRRVVEWYLACGQAADQAVAAERTRLPGGAVSVPANAPVPEFADDRAALDWLETEHGALLGALRTAAEHQWDELVWLLCDPLWALNQNHRHPAAWIEALELAITAGERAGNRWVCARLRCLLSRIHVDLGQFGRAAASLAGALDLARLEGDGVLEASVLEFTGIVELEANRPGSARELFDAGRAVLAALDPAPGTQRADLILRYLTGRAFTAQGHAGEAVQLLEIAYPEAGRSDPRLAGQVRFALIEALLATAQPAPAREFVGLALAEASRRAVPVERIRALRLLARACEAAGEQELAVGHLADADALQRGLEGWTEAAS